MAARRRKRAPQTEEYVEGNTVRKVERVPRGAGKRTSAEAECIPYRYSSEKSGKSASDESFFRIVADSGGDLHTVYLCELFKASVFRHSETQSY